MRSVGRCVWPARVGRYIGGLYDSKADEIKGIAASKAPPSELGRAVHEYLMSDESSKSIQVLQDSCFGDWCEEHAGKRNLTPQKNGNGEPKAASTVDSEPEAASAV